MQTTNVEKDRELAEMQVVNEDKDRISQEKDRELVAAKAQYAEKNRGLEGATTRVAKYYFLAGTIL